ncbi:PHD-finger [Ostertagia ostertagi]
MIGCRPALNTHSWKGKIFGQNKHSRPWEVDDGEDHGYDYVSCSESESSSSEEEYSLRTSQSHVFLEDEQDTDCITNDDSFQYSEEDAAECSRIPWIDLPSTEIPPLVLPESSKDIPVPSEYLLDVVELYELLRSYWRTLRLSPFLFEDFCAALSSADNSRLLSEIHLVLLRMCFKNDDEEQVHFSGNETNNAYNIITACLEPMTYAEVLRQYLSSDVNVPVEVMEAVNAPNYPFVDFSTRLVLITFLSYRFLYSNEYKKTVVATGGRLEHEETCRSCCKGGDVLQCDTCEAVFHIACVNLEAKPDEWICELCEKNKVRGVQDCLPLDEYPSKQPLRMEPIGRDRHGRFYWFVARRIFVPDLRINPARKPTFYQLLKLMDPSFYEFHLCKVFFERLSDILEQMSVTLELSSDRRDTLYRDNYNANKALPAEVYLQQDNMYLMAEILSAEFNADIKPEESDEEPKLEDEKPFATLIDYFKTMLGLSNGRLVNNFWSGNWSIAKGHTLYGSEKLQTLYVAWTIGKVLRKIPIELMQRKWRDALPSFKKELDSPTTSWQKLRDLLLRLECGMRRTLFLPQWWNNLGHTRLTRTTVEDRERMMKEAQRRKKEEREAVDAIDEDVIVVKHTRMPHGISRELTRMRDPDRRVVNHFPDRDERRWISLHKEYAPPYIDSRLKFCLWTTTMGLMRKDDLSWTSSERERRKSVRRRKPQSQSSRVRRVSQIKEEWVDGVDLKLYEIYDYWRGFSERFTNRIKPAQSNTPRVQPARSAAKQPQPVKERTASPAPNAVAVRKAISVQDRVRPPPTRTSSTPTPQQLRRAPVITTDRSRKVQRISDYQYFPPADEGNDDESCDSTYTEGSELTGWEPRAAKRPRLSTPRMDSSRLLQTLTPPTSRAVSGRPYQVGYIRGGGRGAMPVGDGMQPAGLLEESVVPLGAEETIVTSDVSGEESAPARHPVSSRQMAGNGMSNDGPPVIPRYDNIGGSYSGRVASARVLSPMTTSRRSPVVVPTGAGKLLMVRRSDGTTQFLRQIPQPSDEAVSIPTSSVRSRIPPNIRTAPGSRILHLPGGDQEQSVHSRMVVSTEPPVVRTSYEQPVDPFMKRMAVVEKAPSAPTPSSQRMIRHVPMPMELHGGEMYSDSVLKDDEQVVYNDQRFGTHSIRPKFVIHRAVPTVMPRPYDGWSRVQSNSFGSSLPMRRITSYKEFCRRRGVSMRAPTRPYRFDFENNEDEERAIAEAIAREEELMRQEEADKGGRPEPGARDPAGRPYDEDPEEHARMVPSHFGMGFYPQPAIPRYTSNLAVHRDDSPDTRAVKQVLETMVMQACRWDKQFGWYKNLLMKPSRPHFDRFKRRMFTNQRETVLAEHIDRLRKEINKRRTRLENKAEEMCGLPTPWRKSRMKSHMRGECLSNSKECFLERRMFTNQRETVLAEHIDRLRKEINKRRTRLENKAEEMCGLPTPWRKSRMKSHMRASRGSSNVKNADASRPVPVVINPAEISLGGDSVDWTKDSESSTVLKEAITRMRIKVESKLESEQGIVEESNAVADWQPSRRGPALPPTPKYKKKMYERSLEESSSSGSEVRRRGRPPKRHHQDIEEQSTDDKPAPLGANPNALHCICRTTYNPRRFYVACEMCFRWFHGDCVGVSEENAKEMDGWTCRDCIQETKRARQEQELYCTCRTPYNDNEFYVGCESCEGWFHPKCVGITQEEAEAMDEYVCPSCTEAQTTQGYESATSSAIELTILLCGVFSSASLITVCRGRSVSQLTLKSFPITFGTWWRPIDLSIIQQRLENLEYQRLKDFTRDMSRLFENARIFYPRDSNVYHCADTLEKIFEHALAEVRTEIDARVNGRKVSESQTIDSSLDIDTDQLIDVNLDVDPSMFLL